jgi:hypothetical protein
MFANLTGKQKSAAVILIILCLVAIVLAIYFGVSKRCPAPQMKPSFKKFNDSSTTNPWSVPTYYKYSYYDVTNKQEGPQSASSDKVQSNDSTNPIIQVVTNSLYSIRIYRAVNTPDVFTLLTVTVDPSGQFTDTQNPAPPRPMKPSFKKFNVSDTTNPWSVPTYYKYSYYDVTNKQEGPQSEPSDKVQSSDSTNPIIQVVTNSLYSIKIYRAVNTPPGDYTLLDVTVDASGQFTDTLNPAPPKPITAPTIEFTTQGGLQPWLVTTFYKYSYFDTTLNIEGPLSESSLLAFSLNLTNPVVTMVENKNYQINLYRAVKTTGLFKKIVNIPNSNTYTDTDNPSPPVPNKPVLKEFQVKSSDRPWLNVTSYKYAYVNQEFELQGPMSSELTNVTSKTATNPIITFSLNPK